MYHRNFTCIADIPVAERFSFLLVTLLTDIAALSKDAQVIEKVLAVQVEVLAVLTAALTKASSNEGVHSTSAGKSERITFTELLIIKII